jgi:ferredoxin
MAITRVWIEEGCISCGMSELNCPEVFKVETGETSKVIEGVDYSGLEEKIKMAAKVCPADVIKYDEDDDVLAEMFADDDGASNEAT